MKTRQIRQLKF